MNLKNKLLQLIGRVSAMRLSVYAGNASFFLLLSVFPSLSLLLSILPYTPLTVEHLLDFCQNTAPDWMQPMLAYLVRTLYASSSAAIISLSAVLALWSASKGLLSLLYGLNSAAEVRESRGYLLRRLLCVLYTVGLLLALILMLGLYVAGQSLLRYVHARGFALAMFLEPLLRHLHLFSLVFLTVLFCGIFLALPNKRQSFAHVLPGAAGAACAWILFSELYSYYVNYIAHGSSLYGSLSVLLTLLLWLYACISILFYGALLNHLLFDRGKPKGRGACLDM